MNLLLLSAGLTDDGKWKESRYQCKGKTFFDISPYDRIVFNRSPVDARMLFSFLVVRPWTNACFLRFGLFVHGRSCVFLILGCSPVDERMFFSFSAVRPWANGVFSTDSIGAKSCSKAFLSR